MIIFFEHFKNTFFVLFYIYTSRNPFKFNCNMKHFLSLEKNKKITKKLRLKTQLLLFHASSI